ncbi:MAG: PAS domain-containing sensor histidine kinase [Reichenbachiella sp.]|uniref:sensor histidine kinase n=1 Tax=Reichenbachiella sp. TaxID=2184521 RepID=UPI0032981633
MKQKDLIAQLEHTNDRLWSYDTELICTYVNSNMSEDYLRAFGRRLTIGLYVLDNVPEPIFSIWKERYQRALAGERFTIVDHFEIEGVPEYVEVSFNPIRENGKIVSVACSSRDISVGKRTELRLEQSEANLHAQIENTTDSIWSVNDKYALVTMNSVFKREFDRVFRSDLHLGDVIIDYLPEPHRTIWKDRYDRSLAGEKFELVETHEFEKPPVHISISYNPVSVENKIVGVACFTRDITALKTSEVDLKGALASRDKLFSVIAHDLRGPIANILQLTKLLKKQKGDIEVHQSALNLLANSSASVYRLLDNLLNWALSQQGIIELKPEKHQLKGLVHSAMEAYLINANLKRLNVKVDIKEDLFVVADKSTFSSVIANLFNNAIKYTSKGGTICFDAIPNDELVTVQIKDTGIGMSKEQIESLLKKNLIKSTLGTKHEKGTGLGLVLTKEFVKLNKGQLNIKSEVGKGSIFEFTVPTAS